MSLSASLFANKVNPFKHPLNDWNQIFATENGCWVWPEVGRRRELDHQAGWNTCQWYGLWDRRYLDGWVQQHGDVVSARHWFRITAIMQKLGWGAIEGCKKIWGIARRLWLNEEATCRRLPRSCPQSVGRAQLATA